MKPRLRFNYNENYSYELFKDVFQIKNNNSFSREELKAFGNFKNIHYGDIHTKLNKIINVQSTDLPYIAQENEVKLTELCNDYDVLIADASEDYSDIGKCIQLINVKNCVAGLHTVLARPKYKSLYLTHLLSSWYVRKQFMKLACGAKVLGLSKSSLQKVVLPFPKLEEQNKIATFLNLYYKKIELQKKKVDLFESIIMPIFNFYLKSESFVYLKDTCSHKIKGSTVETCDNGNLLLTVDYLENKQAVYTKANANITYDNIIILWDGAQAGKVYYGHKGVLGSTFAGLIISQCYNPLYIYYYLKMNLNKIQRVWREGSGIPHLSKNFISKFKILTPALQEQNNIVNILQLIDKKIELEKQKLEAMEKYKQGLLQQLFV